MDSLRLRHYGTLVVLFACLACFGSAGAQDAKAGTVALVAGRAITEAQLEELAKDRLEPLRISEARIKHQVLQEYITRTLLEQEARAQGVSVQELEEREIAGRAQPVTDAQKRAAYDKSGDLFSEVPETVALTRIEAGLTRRNAAEAKRAFVEGLRAKAGTQVFLAPPAAPVAPSAARVALDTTATFSKGPASARVTVTEFSDFQCPACRRGVTTVKRIQEVYGDKVRIVFRDFPLAMHPNAAKAAEAARCAGQQGKFWEMHDRLFANQRSLQPDGLKQLAAGLGLNQAQFDECLDSGRHSAAVRKDMEEGRRGGVRGTPTFFVNGRIHRGPMFETLAALIDAELLAASSTPQPAAVAQQQE
jgi:protein-disulfide isomerase